MNVFHRRHRFYTTTALFLVALWALGCQGPEPSGLDNEPQFARGGHTQGGKGGGAKDPTVKSVFPDSAVQDTTLDVEVSGSNFDDGSEVSFERNGQAVSAVHVNGTQFVNKRTLLANVTVDLAADTGFYDVAVTSSRGSKGVGIESFKVKLRVEATFQDAASDGIRSDGDGPYVVEAGAYFHLDEKADTERQLCLDFHGQVSNADAGFSDQPLGTTTLCDDGYMNTSVTSYLEDGTSGGVGMDQMAIGEILHPRWFSLAYVREYYNRSLMYGIDDCDPAGHEVPAQRASITRLSTTQWKIEATTATLCRWPIVQHGKPKPTEIVATQLAMPVTIMIQIVGVLE